MTFYVVAYFVLGFIISALAYRFGFIDDGDICIISIFAWILFYPIIIIIWATLSLLVFLWLFIAEGGRTY